MLFYQKAAIGKKTAPAAGFIQKDTSRIIANSIGGPGAEPPGKIWRLCHKGLSVFFSFSSGQVRCLINFPVAA